MIYKKIIPYINAKGRTSHDIISMAQDYSYGGADELIIYNETMVETEREELLSLAKSLDKVIDIPFTLGCYISRLEDVKKALYTGAMAALIPYHLLEDVKLLQEASARFATDKIAVEIEAGSNLLELLEELEGYGVGRVYLNNIDLTKDSLNIINNSPLPIVLSDVLELDIIEQFLGLDKIVGFTSQTLGNIMELKHSLKNKGILVNTFESSIPFAEFKVNEDGLLPVVTQDYKTGEVLMLAYMDEEAYNMTIATGRMTYYSRSRKQLWIKGETSDHYQYLKELSIDCDKDTLLAKVVQIGAACHTGSMSCFYTNLVKKDYKQTDPFHVLQNVYDVIMDRKKTPKEGSYTNYLFDKGIDKILKKCGEEATEIIIAAKNPDSEELRYEIADFLYHIMVLMAECGLDWDDILTELANRK
ncbi:MAG: bifunctional phosphoribosyl-AMP cyclohydrolase/phosphoribosyl-ATP diphosphatase HisIE [Clostridiales bacterium]|nr:bifunctional phosphoribosyl-AMP cyclohydrolase/phosphoribosyl-ATP diphosphatase HisIE [Clostridiales bacterium]